MFKKIVGFICLIYLHLGASVLIPRCVIPTPHSVLLEKEKHIPLYIGGRTRYSTCTGVTWFHENYLAVINLYGNRLDIYSFDRLKNTCAHIQEITNDHGAELGRPENIIASPDGKFLAVASDYPKPGVILYSIDQETHRVDPTPRFRVIARGLTHNVRFTPDSKFLATAGWDHRRALCFYKFFVQDGVPELKEHCIRSNNFSELVSKIITFTANGRFAIASHSVKAAFKDTGSVHGCIQVYKFDQEAGMLGKSISLVEDKNNAFCYEDVVLLDNDTKLLFTDQNNDRLVLYSFDPESGAIASEPIYYDSKDLLLDFPHGMSLSHDKKYLAITNYGNDTCVVYELL